MPETLTTIKKSLGNPKLTIFCAFSREYVLDEWIKAFDDMGFPYSQTELVFYVDHHEATIPNRLINHFKKQDDLWHTIQIVQSGQRPTPEVRIATRRDRIVEMKEASKRYIGDSEFVFGLEDDTIPPPDAYYRLDKAWDAQTGYVEGVQVGRWGFRMVGAWKTDNIKNPTQIETLIPLKDGGIEEIDGGGFYCYLTRTDLYKEAKYHWHDECFGPDVNYGIELRKKGLKCKIDWDLICGHLTRNGIIRPDTAQIIGVSYRKSADGQWSVATQSTQPEGR